MTDATHATPHEAIVTAQLTENEKVAAGWTCRNCPAVAWMQHEYDCCYPDCLQPPDEPPKEKV